MHTIFCVSRYMWKWEIIRKCNTVILPLSCTVKAKYIWLFFLLFAALRGATQNASINDSIAIITDIDHPDQIIKQLNLSATVTAESEQTVGANNFFNSYSVAGATKFLKLSSVLILINKFNSKYKYGLVINNRKLTYLIAQQLI